MKTTLGVTSVTGALMIAACSAGPAASDLPDNVLVLNDWVPGDGAMQMLLEGTLEIRNGCLVVATDDPGDEVVVAFPRSLVEWDASTGVLTYGGLEYRIGDHVSMGGGGLETGSGLDIPEACAALAAPYYFVVQDTTLEPWTPAE